ncbi:transmembrane and coiled-coil domain-containing protein 6 [Brachyhypopomus gauderio]|uniref:transmembrane and coiled-coil domain-containing protein 6 n=1 Tax=Brachyhypopomus gauderio TaxID=698409 RepID=UPI0040417905
MIMWRLKAVRHKASRSAKDLEEFQRKRREHEKALRQARRDRQLISKRLLLNGDEEKEKDVMETDDAAVSQDQIREMIRSVQCGGEERVTHLAMLRKTLRNPQTHVIFTKVENSMYVLVGQLSGHNAQCQLEAAQCLHQLSQSPHPGVGQACLAATPYLLTYLSSPSSKLTELCLYTLGNLWPEGALVRERLLSQGMVTALANCIQNKSCNLAVVEAVAFTLSQLLQEKTMAHKVIPLVMASGMVPHLISVLTPDPEFGLGPAIECAWCLHYLACAVDTSALLPHGVVSRCSNLLITLGGAVAKGNTEEGLELLIWPLLRCLGNMLATGACEGAASPLAVEDVRLLAALCVFSQTYLSSHSALTRESLWVINNLTADSPVFCSALLLCNLVPHLLQLLPFSKGINTMVLRILGNVAYKGTEYCVQLSRAGLLPALCATLKMADLEVVTLSLEVLHMLNTYSPQVAEEFVKLNGLPLLEAIQYNNEKEQRVRASYILDHYFHTQPMVEHQS